MARQIPLPALGQYSVTQLQAPSVPVPQTNKLLELAKGLNVVSDIVTTYDQIKQTQSRQQAALEKARALKGEERKAYEQALMTEGATQFQLDPGGVSRQMEAYEREVRKLTEEGKMPPQANALFMLGAKQAKGQVLAKSVYREMLFNPQTISETISPEETVLQKRQELFSRPEFQSELVKQAALKEIEKVEQDFIKDVNARFDAIDIEDAKTNWLQNGRDVINQAIIGQLDINDPSIVNWINHKAGLFQGSRKYAWDNLISETLNEGLSKDPSEEGSISPQQAEKFLDKLRTLDLGGGVKFADAEVGNSITSYYDKINDKRSKWEARKNEQLKTQYETNKGVLTNLLFEAMGDGNSVPTEDARKLKAAFLQQTPLQYDAQASADFESILKSINQPSDDASKLVVGSFDTLIAEGEDLTRVQKDIDKAFSSNSISAQERLTLLNKIESERDFDKLVHKTEGVRKLSESYEELITGFRSMRIGKATYEDSYFAQLGIPDDLSINDRQDTKKNGSVFSQIANKKGGYEAKRFVNNRYYAFQKYFRQANLFKFKEYEADPETTPQEAANKVLEEMRETATEVFKVWENESIREAQRLYEIVVYKKAEDIPEPEF